MDEISKIQIDEQMNILNTLIPAETFVIKENSEMRHVFTHCKLQVTYINVRKIVQKLNLTYRRLLLIGIVVMRGFRGILN